MRVLIVKHLKLGKAWDEASREGRHWVDALARAAVDLNQKFVYSCKSLDVRRTCTWLVSIYTLPLHWRKLYTSILEQELSLCSDLRSTGHTLRGIPHVMFHPRPKNADLGARGKAWELRLHIYMYHSCV